MSTTFTKIKSSRIQAMKDKNEIAKSFYSTFMGEIEKEAKNAMTEPTDVMVEVIAKKMAKNIQDNIKLYSEKGIDHSKELAEFDIISQFLPQLLTEEQTREVIKNIIDSNPSKWGDSMGPLMGAIKKELGNTVDMAIASRIARELLS